MRQSHFVPKFGGGGGCSAVVDVEQRVRRALRNGQPVGIVAAVETLSPAARARLRPVISDIAKAIDGAALGDRDERGRWAGELRNGHHSAATTAMLATATLSQAARLHPVDLLLARDLIPRLFPSDLHAFVDAWSHRFLASPKAWDRNRGIAAMFDWAQRGLIRSPSQHGAVLLLISQPNLWRYLNERPVVINTTLPLFFRVPGVEGASAAQRDETMPGGTLGEYVVPRLIRNGTWARADVLAWCDIALSISRSEYELRWFRRLQTRVSTRDQQSMS